MDLFPTWNPFSTAASVLYTGHAILMNRNMTMKKLAGNITLNPDPGVRLFIIPDCRVMGIMAIPMATILATEKEKLLLNI
jgi:hypothetical protein